MSYKTLSLKNDQSVWTLTIQRPESLNALNNEVLKEINLALDELQKKNSEQCRVLILTGAGEKAFVAGADIKEMSSLSSAAAQEFAQIGQKTFRRFEHLNIPVIAAVNGFALGGGLELALCCDFIYASENAKLGLPEVSLGLIPGFGGTVRLARAVGLAKAKELIFSAEMLTALQALELGLVAKVVPLAELLASVQKLAQTISSRGPLAVANAKKSIMQAYDLDIDSAMQSESEFFAKLFNTMDMREGTQAFIEKRKAIFKGN